MKSNGDIILVLVSGAVLLTKYSKFDKESEIIMGIIVYFIGHGAIGILHNHKSSKFFANLSRYTLSLGDIIPVALINIQLFLSLSFRKEISLIYTVAVIAILGYNAIITRSPSKNLEDLVCIACVAVNLFLCFHQTAVFPLAWIPVLTIASRFGQPKLSNILHMDEIQSSAICLTGVAIVLAFKY